MGTWPYVKDTVYGADIISGNELVRYLKETADVGMILHHIPIEKVITVIFADASLANLEDGKSQGASMVCIANKDMLKGGSAECNAVYWRSGKIERQCSSSLSTESNAMAAASHQGEWVQQVFAEFTNALADEQYRRNVLRAWESSTPEASPAPGPRSDSSWPWPCSRRMH